MISATAGGIGIWICVAVIVAVPFTLVPVFRSARLSPVEKFIAVLVVVAVVTVGVMVILGLLIVGTDGPFLLH